MTPDACDPEGDKRRRGGDGDGALSVRAMEPADFGMRSDYFHHADDETLKRLGVDRALLPSPEAWRASFEADLALAPAERSAYFVVWEQGGETIGFSSADRIAVSDEAHMHLHITRPGLRRQGLGTELVRLTARHYFDLFRLERIFCEPNALNVAPNRALQAAGFRYVETIEAAPMPINPLQPVTVWRLDRAALDAP